MTDLLDLYGLAEEHGTEVYWFDLGTAPFITAMRSGMSARNMRTGQTNGHTKSSSRRTSWQKPVSRDIVSPGNWPNILA